MRINNNKLIILLAVAALVGGCNKNKEQDQSVVTRDLVFESFTYDLVGKSDRSEVMDSDTTQYFRFFGQGVLPKDIGDTDIKHLRDTLMKISGLVPDRSGAPTPLLANNVQLTDLPSGEADLNGEVNTSLTTTLVTPRAVVWKNFTETYSEFSAHPNSSTIYINFCMNDGKILQLYDLFRPGYQLKLRELIRQRVMDKKLDLLVRRDEIEIPREFAITSQGLIFSFDPYDIAPYSAGTIEVEVDLESIRPMLSRRGEYILSGIMPPAE